MEPTKLTEELDRFGESMKRIAERRITFANGDTVSIQASDFHYCKPRTHSGPYTHVELGMPDFIDDGLLEYAGDRTTPMSTVYAYVPASEISRLIVEKGGIVHGELVPLTFKEEK